MGELDRMYEDDGLSPVQRANIEDELEEQAHRRRKMGEQQRQITRLQGRVRRLEQENEALRQRNHRLEEMLAGQKPLVIVKPVRV